MSVMQEGSFVLAIYHHRLDALQFVQQSSTVSLSTGGSGAATISPALQLIDKSNASRGCTVPMPAIRRPLAPSMGPRQLVRFLVCAREVDADMKKTAGPQFWLPRLLSALFVQPGRSESEVKSLVLSPSRAAFCRPENPGHPFGLEVREVPLHPGLLQAFEIHLGSGESLQDAAEMREVVASRSLRLKSAKLPSALRDREVGLEYVKEIRRALISLLSETQRKGEEVRVAEETLQELEAFASWANTKATLGYFRAVGDLEATLQELFAGLRGTPQALPLLLDHF